MKKYQWNEWRNSLAPKEKSVTEIVLAENGVTEYKIIIPEDSSIIEKTVAAELAKWLEKITGANFPVSSDQTDLIDTEICIGESSRSAFKADLGIDGIAIQTEGKRLLIQGGKGRGLANAVFAFLEEDLGCRWYGNNAERIPSTPNLKVSPANRKYTPQLKLRDPFYHCSFDGEWSLRNRTNSPIAPVGEEFGGYIACAKTDDPAAFKFGRAWRKGLLFVHTYHLLLSPERYGEEHPEYFQMNANGERIVSRQLCETHPDVHRIVTENTLKSLRAYPESRIISISKADGNDVCLCDSCRSLNEVEGSNAASMLTLVNHVAEAVEKEFPDVTVTTLAYLDTIKLPKTIRPRHNVGVYLCNDQCAWPHPFTPIKEFPEYAAIVKEWADVCDKIYAWDYNANFSHYVAPMENLEFLADNIRFWCENSAESVMTQGDFQGHCAERDLLKCWVVAKLMWDPSLDVFELAQDFIWGYYGKAAPSIAEYNQLLLDQKVKHAEYMKNPPGGIRYPMTADFLADGFVEKADAIFEKALALTTDDPVLTNRIERDYLSVLYVKLEQRYGETSSDYLALVDEFERMAKSVGLEFLGETEEPTLDLMLQVWRDAKKTGRLASLSIPGGTYDGPVNVEVTTPMAVVRLVYTLDGKEPNASSENIDGPIEIKQSCILKVGMIMLGSCCGATVAEASYVIK